MDLKYRPINDDLCQLLQRCLAGVLCYAGFKPPGVGFRAPVQEGSEVNSANPRCLWSPSLPALAGVVIYSFYILFTIHSYLFCIREVFTTTSSKACSVFMTNVVVYDFTDL